jgi:superfamily I DNA and/or RNA helicase
MEKIAVDTIDKMQGQERDVIILSFTTGNAEYMSEMGEFIYNPNKLNVAFSRAKFKLILVGNVKRLRQISPSYPVVGDVLNALNI